MKTLWCWRCKIDFPMLDEIEYADIHELYGKCFRGIKEYRKQRNCTLDRVPRIADFFLPVVEAYERLTGVREENANAIMHHRIAIYGPPCPRCGKLLRTLKASKCFECGAVVAGRKPG